MLRGMVMQKINLTTDQAIGLESFLQRHIYNLHNYLYDEEDIPEGWSPYGIYDGCDVCEVRENLMATFDFLKLYNIVDIAVE
jgi:hypothetical protein